MTADRNGQSGIGVEPKAVKRQRKAKRLVLAGAGHAHLFVLESLVRHPLKDVEVVLVNPSGWQYYSGMLPGWMAGLYRDHQCRIAIEPLAEKACVHFVQGRVAGLDADRNCLYLADGSTLRYDWLSLNTGSETDDAWFAALGDRLLPVKPFAPFMRKWRQIAAEAASAESFHLVVAGGGGAGVEIAFAAREFFDQVAPKATVTLVSGGTSLLASACPRARRKIEEALLSSGVRVLPFAAVGTGQGVMLNNGQRLIADRVIAATGARPPFWLAQSGLKLDARGFAAVDRFHRSRSHHNVFAVGDISAREDRHFGRSGVHAVRAGPVMARNLKAEVRGWSFRPYRPKRYILQLFYCGQRRAVVSWGPWSAAGRMIWRWKDMIDRRFIRRFTGTRPQLTLQEPKSG